MLLQPAVKTRAQYRWSHHGGWTGLSILDAGSLHGFVRTFWNMNVERDDRNA